MKAIQHHSIRYLEAEGIVSIVWRTPEHPIEWNGFRVVSGEKHDLTFLHERPVIVALKAKQTARKDQSGFVLDLEERS